MRSSLVPYLYTYAREAHDTGVSMLRPMYYDYPEDDESYNYTTQYMLGDHLLVSPITAPMNPTYNTTQKAVFLPAGKTESFVSWHSGEVFNTPMVLKRNYTLSEMPVFAVPGSVIPLRRREDDAVGSSQDLPQQLGLMVFAAGGAAMSGTGLVYEDDGVTNSYKTKNAGAGMSFGYSAQDETATLAISPASGSFDGMLKERSYSVVFRGVWPASGVLVDGTALTSIMHDTPCTDSAGCFSYDGSHLSLHVFTASLSTATSHTVKVSLIDKLPSKSLMSNFAGQISRLISAKQLLDDEWGIHTVHQQDYYSLLTAGESGMRITYEPSSVHTELENFLGLLLQAQKEVAALKLPDNVKSVAMELLQA